MVIRGHWRASDLAPRVPEVAGQALEPTRAAGLVEPLARARHVTEGTPGRVARLVARPPIGDEPVGLDLQVDFDLPLEVAIVLTRAF